MGVSTSSRAAILEPRRSFVLIDRENLVIGFQKMAETRQVNTSVTHIRDLFVWHPYFASSADVLGIVRVSYYMSVVGSHDAVDEAKDKIGATLYTGAGHGFRITPHVFKKDARSKKTKIVDISITIDALRHAYNDHIDQLYLFSGDSDYVPLVQEVMRQGKRVIVGALSDGLSPHLRRSADAFIDLDRWCFLS